MARQRRRPSLQPVFVMPQSEAFARTIIPNEVENYPFPIPRFPSVFSNFQILQSLCTSDRLLVFVTGTYVVLSRRSWPQEP